MEKEVLKPMEVSRETFASAASALSSSGEDANTTKGKASYDSCILGRAGRGMK